MSKEKPFFKIDEKFADEYRVHISGNLPICFHLKDQELRIVDHDRFAQIKIKKKTIKKPLAPVNIDHDDFKIQHIRRNPYQITEFSMGYKPTLEELKDYLEIDEWEEDPYTERAIDPLLQRSVIFLNRF